MNYQEFCDKVNVFSFEEYDAYENLYATELKENFFVECYLYQKLSGLLNLSATKETLTPDAEEDLGTALDYLFSHYPVCNLEANEVNNENAKKPRFLFDTEQAISNCKRWFSILYQNNCQLCKSIFPVITYILGDSHEYLLKQEHVTPNGLTYEALYKFISDHVTGKFRGEYFFSLLSADTAKKSSCIEHGRKIITAFKENLYCDWINLPYTWEPAEIKNPPPSYENTVDKHLHLFLKLFEDCNIRNNLSSYQKNRYNLYSQNSKRKNYYPSPALLGENFLALLLYLQDFAEDELKSSIWANFNPTLTLYTLSQMTHWIAPFTTIPTQYMMPLYHPQHPLTCDYFNKNLIPDVLSIKEPVYYFPMFAPIFDDEGAFSKPAAYIPDYYSQFQKWYDNSSEKEKESFDNYLAACSSALFNSFLGCKNEILCIPTKKDLKKFSDQTSSLGYFYCLTSYLALDNPIDFPSSPKIIYLDGYEITQP